MSTPTKATASGGFPIEDLKSGFLVFLIALPLCLGIAMASGFPPVGGVLTAIVGGVVVSFLGSSRLTIKGPAAGLIVIAIGAVTELGQGDNMLGYFSAVSLKYVAMFALIGTIESTLSVLAVDAMDTEKKASNLNKDLLAAGVGNLISASIGGLPMISEIVRSRASIDAGARSIWSNFFHGAFLLLFVAFLPGLLREIPLAALAAMLVYTGYRLASPAEFAHVKELGMDQLGLFATTLVVTLAVDLLVGVAVGLILKVILHLVHGASLKTLFRARVDRSVDGDTIRLIIHGAATFGCILTVRRELMDVPHNITRVIIDLQHVRLVDHTFMSRLHTMADEWPHATLEVAGTENLRSASSHPFASRRKAA